MRRSADSECGQGRPAAAAWMLGLCALCLVSLCSGCGAIGGYFAHLFSPEPTAEARYKLTADTVLLLVDQPPDQLPDPAMRNMLTDELDRQLRNHAASQQLVPQTQLMRLQRSRPAAAQWDPPRLGAELGAKQVLHAAMESYVPPDNSMDPTASLRLAARVRVYDVATGDQLWPEERAGEQAVFEMQIRRAHSLGEDPNLERDLAVGLADVIAKFFYKHTLTPQEAFRLRQQEPPQ